MTSDEMNSGTACGVFRAHCISFRTDRPADCAEYHKEALNLPNSHPGVAVHRLLTDTE